MRSAVVVLMSGLLAASTWWAPAAAAEPAATAIPAPAEKAAPLLPRPAAPRSTGQLSNTVQCVFDMMTDDDRELSMLMLANEVLTASEDDPSSKNFQVIDRLIGEAADKCDTAYHWSSGRAGAAKDHAMAILFSDALGQFIGLVGQATPPIDAYFNEHRMQLSWSSTVRGIAALHFRAYLVEQGWDEDDKDRLNIAASYLETLMLEDASVRAFAAAPLHAAQARPPSRSVGRPSRAKKAQRGRP